MNQSNKLKLSALSSLMAAFSFIKSPYGIGWGKYLRKLKDKKVLLGGIDILRFEYLIKKRYGRYEKFKYEKKANGEIRKIMIGF